MHRASSCFKDDNQIDAINHQLGDEIPLSSPYTCGSGQHHVIDHLDHNTSQYRVIHEGSQRTTVTIAGVDDGGIYRFHCIGSTSYCYVKVNGMFCKLCDK